MQIYDVKCITEFRKKPKVIGRAVILADNAKEARKRYMEKFHLREDDFDNKTFIDVYGVGDFYMLE